MPELPEVEVIARGLAAVLEGRRVTRVDLRRPDIVRGHRDLLSLPLERRRIVRIRRAGKLVRFEFTGDIVVCVHLGMSGRLLALTPDAPVESHTHLRVRFGEAPVELRYCDPRRFGGVWIMNGDRGADWAGRRLPPIASDPLELTLEQWRGLLKRRRQIKALLMAQEPISGIGNIYCDESLHRAGIHPLTRACDLDDALVARLCRAVRRVLAEAIAAGGSSISDYRGADNQPGTFHRRHRVYGREGRPCRRCRTPIERIVVAGRGTHLCPRCQRLTAG